MKIKKILNQSRRDFNAIYECEHCEHEERSSGYDDSFFHNEVIPKMNCDNCGKTSGDDFRPLAPKYSASTII